MSGCGGPTLSDTFGGEFKRKPKLFWDAVRKYDSNLPDYFLKMHGVDPEDYHFEKPEASDDFYRTKPQEALGRQGAGS